MKFVDYESSHITPQMTLLKKFNEVLKFLRGTNLDNELFEKYLEINETIQSGSVISNELISKILKAEIIKYNNSIYTLSYKNYTYNDTPVLSGIKFSNFTFSGDETTFEGKYIYIDITLKTFNFKQESYYIGE